MLIPLFITFLAEKEREFKRRNILKKHRDCDLPRLIQEGSLRAKMKHGLTQPSEAVFIFFSQILL